MRRKRAGTGAVTELHGISRQFISGSRQTKVTALFRQEGTHTAHGYFEGTDLPPDDLPADAAEAFDEAPPSPGDRSRSGRGVLDRLGDKWSTLILVTLSQGPQRHATLHSLRGRTGCEAGAPSAFVRRQADGRRLRRARRGGALPRRPSRCVSGCAPCMRPFSQLLGAGRSPKPGTFFRLSPVARRLYLRRPRGFAPACLTRAAHRSDPSHWLGSVEEDDAARQRQGMPHGAL